MISAAEALRLPGAQLSADELRALDEHMSRIEAHVREHMTRAGCEVVLQLKENRSPVLAELTYRLKLHGWIPQWQAVVEKARFSENMVVVAFRLVALGPTDESREAARAIFASA